MRSITAAAASLLLLCAAQAASAQTNSSALLSQLQLNPLAQRASDAAKSKAGVALSAAEAGPQTAVSIGNDVLSASVGAGYPNSRVNSSCIKTSFEFAQAFKAGTQRCVSPCLFGRFVDTNADPIWKANSPLPPKNASEFMKGERVTLAFIVPNSGLESFLETSAKTGGNVTALTEAILNSLGIDNPQKFGLNKGDRIPLKIFGDDCSLFERTNRQVQISYPTFPDAFDRVTRDFKLNPTVLGEVTLRGLQEAYSYGGGSVAAQFSSLTECNVNPAGTDAPNCDTVVNGGPSAGIPAGSGAGCTAYVAALKEFCTPAGKQNYDSASCVATITKLAAANTNGQATPIQARAMFAACYDFLAGFNTDNSMITDPDTPGKLLGREYLITGNGLLAQAGGYFIEWLTV